MSDAEDAAEAALADARARYEPPPDEPGPAPADDDDLAVDRRLLELRGQLLNLDGLRNIPPPEPLVDGYLFRDSIGWLSGKPGHAKTFAATGLACCVGTGTPWHGREVKTGLVLYLIAESAGGIPIRVDAWERPAIARRRTSCSCPSRCR